MKLQITKKTAINYSRKTLTFLFFLLIMAIIIICAVLAYIAFTRVGRSFGIKNENKTVLDTKSLDAIDNYQYKGSQIDLNGGLGKTNPFK